MLEFGARNDINIRLNEALTVQSHYVANLVNELCFNPIYSGGENIGIEGISYSPQLAVLKYIALGDFDNAYEVARQLQLRDVTHLENGVSHPIHYRAAAYPVDEGILLNIENLANIEQLETDIIEPENLRAFLNALRRESIRSTFSDLYMNALAASYNYSLLGTQNKLTFSPIQATPEIHAARKNLSQRAIDAGVFHTDNKFSIEENKRNSAKSGKLCNRLKDFFFGSEGVLKNLGFCPLIEPGMGVVLVNSGTSGSFHSVPGLGIKITDNEPDYDNYQTRTFFYHGSQLQPMASIIVNTRGYYNVDRSDEQLLAVAVEEIVQNTIYPAVNLCLPPGMDFYFEEEYASRVLEVTGLSKDLSILERTCPQISDDEKQVVDKLLDKIWSSEKPLIESTLRELANFRDSHLEYFPDRKLLMDYYKQKLN